MFVVSYLYCPIIQQTSKLITTQDFTGQITAHDA